MEGLLDKGGSMLIPKTILEAELLRRAETVLIVEIESPPDEEKASQNENEKAP